ncbi:MAG TPA: hypothetical protein VHE35_30760 [Kofleriaceae bacterium]|nr:hypothetical protein [Kofleriaceae bacterium]
MRSLLVAASLVIVTGACGPSRAPGPAGPGGGAGSEAEGGSGSAGTRANGASCPAAYAQIHVGEPCTDTRATCAFAEGRCWCAPGSYCGGVAPTPEILAALEKPRWQCQPVRTDGCPETPPTGACSEPGKACSYGDCCIDSYACQGGTWTRTGGGCPP